MCVLKSVRDLSKFRVLSAEGALCGRVRDIYFDDQSWVIKYVVFALDPRRFEQKLVLITPDQILALQSEEGFLQLHCTAIEADALPLASSVLPVCKQYASMALSSPGARVFGGSVICADPHLRSAKAVMQYRLNLAGESAGTLADLIFEDGTGEIRFLEVEQVIESRKVQFNILPQSVERFTWATERILLRDLNPVEMAAEQSISFAASAA